MSLEDTNKNKKQTPMEQLLFRLINVQETISTQNNLNIDMANTAKFTVKFTGDPKQTLPYIQSAKLFLTTAQFITPAMKFRAIYSSLNSNFKREFVRQMKLKIENKKDKNKEKSKDNLGDDDDESDKHENEDDVNKNKKEQSVEMVDNKNKNKDKQHTVDDLFDWMLNQYSPPESETQFRKHLLAIRIKYRQNPMDVLNHINRQFNKISEAIEMINKNVKKGKIPDLNNDFKIQIYKNVFVKHNNSSYCNNESVLNRKIVKFIEGKDPKTIEEWDSLFAALPGKLVPRVHQDNPQYEFKIYQYTTEELDIYYSPKRGIKRQRNNNNINKPNNPKKVYKFDGNCNYCGKYGHKASNCRSNPNNKNPNNDSEKRAMAMEKYQHNYNNNRNNYRGRGRGGRGNYRGGYQNVGNRYNNNRHRNNEYGNKSELKCYRCHKIGHIKRNCTSTHYAYKYDGKGGYINDGIPPGLKNQSVTPTKNYQQKDKNIDTTFKHYSPQSIQNSINSEQQSRDNAKRKEAHTIFANKVLPQCSESDLKTFCNIMKQKQNNKKLGAKNGGPRPRKQ